MILGDDRLSCVAQETEDLHLLLQIITRESIAVFVFETRSAESLRAAARFSCVPLDDQLKWRESGEWAIADRLLRSGRGGRADSASSKFQLPFPVR